MADDRVVVIGAGVGGLVSAALLAAHGYDVTVVEARRRPGRQVARGDVDGGAHRCRPDGVHACAAYSKKSSRHAATSLDDHLILQPATMLARHAWGRRRGSTCSPIPRRSEAAIGDFAGAAEARGYRAFRAEAKRLFDALDRPFLRDTETDPLDAWLANGRARFRRLLHATSLYLAVARARRAISATRGCGNCSAATRPIADPRRSVARRP